MYSISATRTSTISVRNDRSLGQNDSRDALHGTAGFKGCADLLQDTSLETVLNQPGLRLQESQIIRRALVNDYFPSGQNDSDDVEFFACWLVQHKQARLLSLWLQQTPLSIPVSNNEIAAGLLSIMQSTLSFSGLRLEFLSVPKTAISEDVIPLLGQAFQANASLTRIAIFSNDYDSAGLSPLFDVLAGVAGLELITEGELMTPADVGLLGKLLSKNKTLGVLELDNLGSGTYDHGRVAPGTGSAADVIEHIAGQLQLERLKLSNTPPQSQAVIGKLMCTSHVLKELKIGLDGSQVDTALVDGFSQTSSVESVCLSVHSFEKDMLAFVTNIAKTNVSIKSLKLQSRNPEEDLFFTSGIFSLISGNRSLVSLTCHLPYGCKVDLAKIGSALEKNVRLETLMLLYKAQSNHGWQPEWINETSISALVGKLKQNRTLTELVLVSEDEVIGPIKKNYSVLQQVLDRNRAFQRHACSDAFLYGAVEGFFATMHMPADLAIATAKALMHYRPRTGVAALALINKPGYARALSSRRQAHTNLLNQVLPIERNLVVNNRQEMIGLLYAIIATNADFSIAELSRIAESPTLPGALVAIMFRSPHDYLYLVELFCQALGLDKMRSLVIGKIVRDDILDASASDGTGNDFLLSMLEQSFPPDQDHLLPFVEKELNYHAINSSAAKLFVGYNIPKVRSIASNKAELPSWCVENNQPGILIAFYDACPSKVRIDFKKYSGPFARSMLNKIPLLKKADILFVEGIPTYEDALVLYRALAETSILEELHIDESNCGQEFDFIMQGLGLNKSIKQLTLACRTMSNPPAISDTLAGLLAANSTIEFIDIAHYDDDPELPELTQLAATDDRLNLKQLEHDEAPSDPDEAPVQ